MPLRDAAPPGADTPPNPPSRQRRKEARPQELLDAALALFVEKGFAATRSEEVAARAGVAKGTLYLYYPSKEELLKEVIRQNLSQLIAEGVDLAGSFEGSSADLLGLLMRTWWDRIGSVPGSGILKIMMSEAGNFPEIARFYADEVIAPGHRLIADTVRRGVDSGEFRPVPIDEVTMALIAPMLFMSLHKHSMSPCSIPDTLGDPLHAPEPDPNRVVETHIDLLLHGLLQAAPAALPAGAAFTRCPQGGSAR